MTLREPTGAWEAWFGDDSDAGDGTPEATPAPPAPAAGSSRHRRARTLTGALALTALSAALPGAGLLWARRWIVGLLLLLPVLAAFAWAGVLVARGELQPLLDVAFDPDTLERAALIGAALTVVWAISVLATYLVVRPTPASRVRAAWGSLLAATLVLALATPLVMAGRYAVVQADLVRTVFEDNDTATLPQTPNEATRADPWGGRDTVSVLLLGGDDGPGRTGVRTDTVLLLRADVTTGDTVMFSLPRNLMYAQFPADSPLHDLYPSGFTGYGDPAGYMLNAVYGQVPLLHPGVLGRSSDEGADAIKLAVEGSLGVDVDYYALVNLNGFQQLVDAMGGVTVDINEYVAVEGDQSAGIPPVDYLEPGPDQHLDGYHALWFARGRYGSDDYSRMLRQRCLIGDLIDEADPLTLLRRYQALAEAGKEIVRTDIPASLLPAFVELGLRAKSADVRSVAFVSSPEFSSSNPDYAWMQEKVLRALDPPSERPERPDPSGEPSDDPSVSPTPEPGDGDGSAVRVTDSCAYDPGIAAQQPAPY